MAHPLQNSSKDLHDELTSYLKMIVFESLTLVKEIITTKNNTTIKESMAPQTLVEGLANISTLPLRKKALTKSITVGQLFDHTFAVTEDSIVSKVNMDKLSDLEEKINCERCFTFNDRLKGWNIECRQRTDTKMCDMYYHHSGSNKVFRSIMEVVNFMIYEMYPTTQRKMKVVLHETLDKTMITESSTKKRKRKSTLSDKRKNVHCLEMTKEAAMSRSQKLEGLSNQKVLNTMERQKKIVKDRQVDPSSIMASRRMVLKQVVSSLEIVATDGDARFVMSSYQSKDGGVKLQTWNSLGSFDQNSSKVDGAGACSTIALVVADWLLYRGTVPSGAQMDDLVREGAALWQDLRKECTNPKSLDFHFELDTVLAKNFKPVVCSSPLVGLFPSDEPDNFAPFEHVLWNVCANIPDNGTRVFIVGWNCHFYVLFLTPLAFYVIDSLGSRLSEKNKKAYVLKFDEHSSISFKTQNNHWDVKYGALLSFKYFLEEFLAEVAIREFQSASATDRDCLEWVEARRNVEMSEVFRKERPL